jgi:uncharacterized protein YjiS (DUF1127 family)
MSNARCETFETSVAAYRGPRTGLLGSLVRAASTAAETFYLWQERAAQRAHLAGLEDHFLKDIGIGRAEAAREAAKPFWRA